MSKGRWVLSALGTLALAVLLFRVAVLPDLLVRQMVVVREPLDRTPADVGLPYEDASFEVEGDRLAAWYVPAPDPKPVAFLLLHGDGESVHDWIPVQKLLHDQGYSSLIYDYAGYGHSEGVPSRRYFSTEPRSAFRKLLQRTEPATRVAVLGHSFGAAIAIEAFRGETDARLHSVIFNSGPPGLRDILHEVLGVPRLVTLLLPNLTDAKNRAADVEVPLLVVSSHEDTLLPPDLVGRVYAGANQPKELLLRSEGDHNELTRANLEWWRPILDWVDGL